MFVTNETTGKYYIDGMEVTAEEYQIRLNEFKASYVPPEPDPDPELTDSEIISIILGGCSI